MQQENRNEKPELLTSHCSLPCSNSFMIMEELFRKASKAGTIKELDALIETNSEIFSIVNEFEKKFSCYQSIFP